MSKCKYCHHSSDGAEELKIFHQYLEIAKKLPKLRKRREFVKLHEKIIKTFASGTYYCAEHHDFRLESECRLFISIGAAGILARK